MSQEKNRSVSLTTAAWRWLEGRYRPIVKRLVEAFRERDVDGAERYCRLLAHKWILSERAQREVGHELALEDLVASQASRSLP